MNKVFHELVKHADEAFENFESSERHRYFANDNDSRQLVISIYAVHLAGIADPVAYAEFLKARDVSAGNRALNQFYATTLAFIPSEDRKLSTVRISQYAQVAHVLHVNGVSPAEAAEWFGERQKIGNQTLVGISKALKLYSRLPEVAERNVGRREEARKKALALTSQVLGSADSQVGEIILRNEQTPPAGTCVIAFGRVTETGQVTVAHLITDEQMVKLLVKHLARDQVNEAPKVLAITHAA